MYIYIYLHVMDIGKCNLSSFQKGSVWNRVRPNWNADHRLSKIAIHRACRSNKVGKIPWLPSFVVKFLVGFVVVGVVVVGRVVVGVGVVGVVGVNVVRLLERLPLLHRLSLPALPANAHCVPMWSRLLLGGFTPFANLWSSGRLFFHSSNSAHHHPALMFIFRFRGSERFGVFCAEYAGVYLYSMLVHGCMICFCWYPRTVVHSCCCNPMFGVNYGEVSVCIWFLVNQQY